MRILFAHDHVFREHRGAHATSGSFPDAVLRRYTSTLGPLTFVGRVRRDSQPAPGLSPITEPDVRIVASGGPLAAPRVVDAEVARADAVIVRLPSRVGLLAWWAARRHGKPTLVEVVGCAYDAYRHHSAAGRALAPFFYAATRAAVRRSSHVLYVTSRFLQRRYPTGGVAIACSDVVLPAPREGVLERRLRQIRSRDPRSPLLLCTVGAIHVAYKGHEHVLRAQRLLKDRGVPTHYWIIGGGDPARLEALVAELGLQDDVTFWGSLPHDDVLAKLAVSDLYVQPSRVEGLPRALLEAMSTGAPALGTRVGGIPELLSGRELFAPGDAAGLADRITALDAAELERMARENHALTSSQYAPDVLAERRRGFLEEFGRYASAAEGTPG